MSNPADSKVQNLLPVQAYFDAQNNFVTFIGQGQPFTAIIDPDQSGLHITNSTIDSSVIGGTTPAVGYFTSGYVSVAPTTATGIANKQYVDYYVAGLSWKQPVKAASLANIASLSGFQTVDSVPLTDGDRVLVKDQSLSKNNGIYVVRSGAWEYAVGADDWQEYVGAIVFVEEGSQAYSAWYSLAQEGGTLGVTALDWANFSVSSTYSAGTGLTLLAGVFSITNTGVTNGTYGSASRVVTQAVNAQGQLTSIYDQPIDIAATQIGSGTIDSARLSGSYTGITGVGILSAGTWNASTIGVGYGGTGATTLTGYVKGNGTSAFTASATIPTTDLSGTISNAQLANSTISGVALGSNLFSLTAGTNISFSSGTTYNGSAAITINASVPAQVYPGAGIANSTGSAWGTSYSTTGSGTVVALATSPSFTTPILGTPQSGNFSTGTFTWPTFNQNTTGTAAGLSATLVVGSGGTGSTSLAANNVLLGNGTSALQVVAPGTSGNVLTSNGTTWVSSSAPATGITITDDTTTNATRYLTFTSATSGSITGENVASTKLGFNPSTGSLGVNTSSPRRTFEVDGTIAAPTALATAITTSAAGTVVISDTGTTVGAVIGTALNGSSYDTYFQARNLGAASTAYNLLLNPLGGNVGVGTSTPGYKLVVSTGASGIISRFTDGVQQSFDISSDSGSGVAGIVSLITANGGQLAFTIGATERFRIGASGQLGIGGANYGTSGYVLTSAGSGSAPTWSAVAGIGSGQTWQDVSGSRSAGTQYTNSTGKPIQLSIGGNDGRGGQEGYVYVTIGGVVAANSGGPNSAYTKPSSTTPIVPAGSTYQVDVGEPGYDVISWWRELR